MAHNPRTSVKPMSDARSDRPPVIVLGGSLTGLATVRSLARGGVIVYAATSQPNQPSSLSRHCRCVPRPDTLGDDASSIKWLTDLCATLPARPVVLPTSDQDALWLAKHAESLRSHCILWSTPHSELLRIVSKDGLYATAVRSKMPVIPFVVEPSLAELEEWSLIHSGPYLLKPFYRDIPGSALRRKNLVIEGREALLSHVERGGSRSLIVQRKIDGGDGFILDCYGLCSDAGVPIVMASHRRIRQCPPHFGSTCLGEIPACGDEALEAKLFEYTTRLLGGLAYHGIFGIEWLHDRATDELYVIDFNARPFSSIGHLTDCGLNLPLLAYRELLGDDLSDVHPRPALAHLYWLDFVADMFSFRATDSPSRVAWLRSLLKCRSFAVWDRGDPGPWLQTTLALLRRGLRKRLFDIAPWNGKIGG